MAQGIKVPVFPLSDIAGRASYFEAAYLKQREVITALEQRIEGKHQGNPLCLGLV
jgi:hypothetical protein